MQIGITREKVKDKESEKGTKTVKRDTQIESDTASQSGKDEDRKR